MINQPKIWPIKTLIVGLIILEILLLFVFTILFQVKPAFLDFLEWEFQKYSWILLLSPLVSLVFIGLWSWKKKALQRWKEIEISSEVISQDVSFKGLSFRNSVVRFSLFKFSLIFLLISILGPRSGGEMTETLSEGVEIMIALDLSKSMLAEDIQPNRLYAAKAAVRNILKKLDGDKVGLVAFSARAYTQMPLSNDYASALNYLETLKTSSVPVQGTSISNAIQECVKGFDSESSANKLLLIFTDGEDHEEEIEAALQEAKTKQIKVSCIAIGSENGAPIPNYGSQEKYKKDKTGKTVITKVNSALLNSIASEGGGVFSQVKSSAPSEAREIIDYIKDQEKTETGSFQFVNLTPRFPIPLSLSILCLILSILIKEKENTWF